MQAVSVDRLLQAMYGEDAAPSNRATLHTYVYNLRRTLGDVIVRQGDGYVLRSPGSTIDAVEFEDACRAAAGFGRTGRGGRTGCATPCCCGAAIRTPTWSATVPSMARSRG